MTRKVGITLCLSIVLLSSCAMQAETLFLAHYNGDTGNSGCDADYAAGSTVASTSSGYYPSINTTTKKFGDGALNEDWWTGRSLQYSSSSNLNLSSGTFEFFLNSNAGYSDDGSGTYVYDGTTRYVMTNDITWGVSGHIDAWFSGSAESETARLVVHIAGSRDGSDFMLTLMGAPMYYSESNSFSHYAIQWDAETGTAAVFTDGILRDKQTVDAWDVTSTSSLFNIGMQSANVAANIIDELRISSDPVYDSSMSIGTKSFDVPTHEFSVPEPLSAIILSVGTLLIARKTRRKL